MNDLVVWLAQMGCAESRVEQNLNLALAHIQHASARADIVVFPDKVLSGSVPACHLPFVAEPWTGRVGGALCEAAKRANVAVALGFVELHEGSCFDASVLVDPEGKVALHHRRVPQSTGSPFGVAGMRREYETALIKGMRVTLLASYEASSKLAGATLRAAGADLILITEAVMEPFASAHNLVLRDFARRANAHVARTNRVGLSDGRMFCGESVILDPNGNVIASASRSLESVVTARVIQEDGVGVKDAGAVTVIRPTGSLLCERTELEVEPGCLVGSCQSHPEDRARSRPRIFSCG